MGNIISEFNEGEGVVHVTTTEIARDSLVLSRGGSGAANMYTGSCLLSMLSFE